MENSPTIILFWYFIIAVFMLMIASLIIAIVLIKKGKELGNNNWKLMKKTCLGIGTVCAIPIIAVLGYILYLYIG